MQMQFLEERQQMTKTRELIEDWQARGFEALQNLRERRCTPDDSASAEYLPILAYYMDHSILVLNANALRDFVATNAMQCLANPCKISRQTVDVADLWKVQAARGRQVLAGEIRNVGRVARVAEVGASIDVD